MKDFLSSCIYKVLSAMQEHFLLAVKTGHWKGCNGPERRLQQCVGQEGSEHRTCIGCELDPLHENI